ncbi:hypothetical protein D3C80_2073250 [compost metagenome]
MVEECVGALADFVIDDPRAFAERHLGPVDGHRFLQLGAVSGVQQFHGLLGRGELFGEGFLAEDLGRFAGVIGSH